MVVVQIEPLVVVQIEPSFGGNNSNFKHHVESFLELKSRLLLKTTCVLLLHIYFRLQWFIKCFLQFFR